MSKLAHPVRGRRVHGIAGGITPAANKAASLRSRIMPCPLAPLYTLPLTQYKSVPLTPAVQAGDYVQKYQRLTTSANPDAAHVHAPTSGRIAAIRNCLIADRVETLAPCIELVPDGADTALGCSPVPDFRKLPTSELFQRIIDAGICGMGGAGFPVAQKLRLAQSADCQLLIINAVECEPFISADHALLRERAADVLLGAEIVQTVCRAARCVIALKRDMHAAISATRSALAHSTVEMLLVDSKYPAGAERQLIEAVTGMQLPAGSLPLEAGILMLNAGTTYACGQAVVTGSPCISRITTLTGSALTTPKNFEALIGTPVTFLLELCGVKQHDHTATVLGGSLLGVELASLAVPSTQTTNCLIAATSADLPQSEPELACIRCGYCADVCPVRLLPQQLHAFARNHAHAQLQDYGLTECIECGACDYVCPSHIPLVQYFRAGKQELRDATRHFEQAESWRTRFQQHQYRLKREKESARERRRPESQPTSAPVSRHSPAFSREQAQNEIAAAVARSKARQQARTNRLLASVPKSSGDPEDSGGVA